MTGSAALVAACSSPKPGEVAKDGSVTVKHIFGETKIPAPPKRVVSAGFTEQDDLLALGVVPIAVTDWFGGQPFGVWPWAQPKLGGAQPVVLNLNDGIQVDQIASLKPDLIVATNAGLDQDTYTKLSAIAPTIAQSGPDAFFEPWKDQATVIGQAVFKADDMAKLIAAVDDKFASVGKNNPQFAGKKVLLLGGTFYEDSVRVTTPGWRTDFLTEMGFTIPDTGGGLVSRDKMASVLDVADVLIWTTESDDEQAALLADPVVAKLQATVREAQCLHRQGPRRGDRVRVDAVLPGGRRPVAAPDRARCSPDQCGPVTSDQTATEEQHAAFAQVGSNYYPIFVAVFTALVIISNVTATKGVAFGPIIGNWSIITDGGFIVFPLTYVIGDVLSEVYGFKAARRAIYLGFAMNVLAALALLGDDLLARPPTSTPTRHISRTSSTPTPS